MGDRGQTATPAIEIVGPSSIHDPMGHAVEISGIRRGGWARVGGGKRPLQCDAERVDSAVGTAITPHSPRLDLLA